MFQCSCPLSLCLSLSICKYVHHAFVPVSRTFLSRKLCREKVALKRVRSSKVVQIEAIFVDVGPVSENGLFDEGRGRGGVSRVVNDDEEAVETILQRLAEDVEGDCWAEGRGCRDYTVRNGFKSFSKLKLERNSAILGGQPCLFHGFSFWRDNNACRDLLFDEKIYSEEYYKIVWREGLRICFSIKDVWKREKLRGIRKERVRVLILILEWEFIWNESIKIDIKCKTILV